MKQTLLIALLMFGLCFSSQAQSKEQIKLEKLLEKGKIEKAQEYYNKVKKDLGSYKSSKLEKILTAAYSEKVEGYIKRRQLDEAQSYYNGVESKMSAEGKSAINAMLGKEYLLKKDYKNALKCAEKSDVSHFIKQVADIYNDEKIGPYDIDIAIKLYTKIKSKFELMEIYFFQKKDYDKANKYCSNSDRVYYGKILLKEGKVEDALKFFRSSKEWGKRYSILDKKPTLKQEVLNYCNENKLYMQGYKINLAEKGKPRDVFNKYNAHNWTIYQMLGSSAGIDDVKNLLNEIKIADDKHERLIILGLISTARFQEAEKYFFTTPAQKHEEYWKFITSKCINRHYEGNSLFKAQLAKKLNKEKYEIEPALADYMELRIKREYYEKWYKSKKNPSVLEEFANEVGPNTKIAGYNACDFTIDYLYIRAGNTMNNLAGRGKPKDLKQAQEIFEFVKEFSVWCVKH